MGSLDLLFAELPDFVEMLSKLLNCYGFMIDSLIFMLMIQCSKAIAANETVEFAKLIVADEIVDYLMLLAFL